MAGYEDVYLIKKHAYSFVTGQYGVWRYRYHKTEEGYLLALPLRLYAGVTFNDAQNYLQSFLKGMRIDYKDYIKNARNEYIRLSRAANSTIEQRANSGT